MILVTYPQTHEHL